jgi:uncharacterized protein with NRDE domain
MAYDAHPDFRLIVAANRDEFLAKPTAPAAYWDHAPQILAGRDLKGGGTWFGITKDGRIAVVTNYRDPRSYRPDAPSRGLLASGYLRGAMPAADYLAWIVREGAAYNGFNVIIGDPHRLYWYSNRGGPPVPLAPGIHGLSNHLLDTPWPKVTSGKEALERLVDGGGAIVPEALFAVLADRTIAPDHFLPDTGVGIERERLLSASFVVSSGYGTRSATCLLIDRDDRVTFSERTFNGAPEPATTVTWQFRIEPAPTCDSAKPGDLCYSRDESDNRKLQKTNNKDGQDIQDKT